MTGMDVAEAIREPEPGSRRRPDRPAPGPAGPGVPAADRHAGPARRPRAVRRDHRQGRAGDVASLAPFPDAPSGQPERGSPAAERVGAIWAGKSDARTPPVPLCSTRCSAAPARASGTVGNSRTVPPVSVTSAHDRDGRRRSRPLGATGFDRDDQRVHGGRRTAGGGGRRPAAASTAGAATTSGVTTRRVETARPAASRIAGPRRRRLGLRIARDHVVRRVHAPQADRFARPASRRGPGGAGGPELQPLPAPSTAGPRSGSPSTSSPGPMRSMSPTA